MRILVSIILTLVAGTVGAASTGHVAERSWQFSVLLDDAPIGYHRFELLPSESGLEVRSEASFDIRILFINAFRYRHSTRELWDGECLQGIESRTRQNGKDFAVSGTPVSEGLAIEANGATDRLDGCVMTFAYWNPRFLQQSRLLNPQTGQYLPVEVEALGREELVVRGQTVVATAYQVTARDLDITVFYSADNEWLGLQSVARGGRVIRYVLT